MTKDEITTSVAFSPDLVNELNSIATDLDPRLYLFAYYEPKTIPSNENYQLFFYYAITNLYGLFWDCGPFVSGNLMMFSPKDGNKGILPRFYNQDTMKWHLATNSKSIENRISTLLEDISSVRTTFCHNNSEMYYLNIIKTDNKNSWFESVLQTQVDEASLSQTEWQKLLISLIQRTDLVISDLFTCLEWLSNIKTTNTVLFESIVNDWLQNGIGFWYKTNKELTINILADFYYYYLRGDISYAITIRQYNQHFSFRANLQKWLVNNFGETAKSGERWLMPSNINSLLSDIKVCPCPVLPVEFLSLLTNDVKTYVQRNRIK